MRKLILTLSLFGFVACTGGGGGGGGAPAGGNNTSGDPNVQKLSANPWCRNETSEVGNLQLRVVLEAAGTFQQQVYTLDGDGSRGGKVGEQTGTWTADATNLTVTPEGESAQTTPYRHIPSGPAGAPQVEITPAGGTGALLFDPCT